MITNIQRKLLFTDKSELAEYLEGSSFNKELYKVYLRVKDTDYKWKTSAVDTFNEVYYQCTRVFDDKNPEEEIYYRYLNDAKDTIGTRYGSDFVFCMVNAVLSVRTNNPYNVELFLAELQAKICKSCYFKPLEDFSKSYCDNNGWVDIDLTPNPSAVSDLSVFDYSDWKSATKDFSQQVIRRIVLRYKSLEDRIAIIDLIEHQQNNPPKYTNPLDRLFDTDLPF